MKSIKITFLLIFSSLLISAQSIPELTKILNKEYEKTLKKKDIIGVSLGILDKDTVAHTQNFGFQDLENNIAATSSTEYKIGSISKVFTAVAILKLQEEGLVDIDKSIKEYIPEINIKSRFEKGNDLIIRDILCHNSGLPSDILNGMFSSDPHDFTWFAEKLNQQYMSSPSNYVMSYSNLGYGMLGELIVRVSGKTYTEYMLENVFTPLQMSSTYVFNGEESLSKAYIGGSLYDPDRVRDQAAGSVVSTIEDMLNFAKMLMKGGNTETGTFLSQESIRQLEENQLAKNKIGTSVQYGFGVFIHHAVLSTDNGKSEDTYIEHGGDTHAFHAHFGYIKNRSLAGVVLTNSKKGGAVNSVFSLLNYYLDHKESSKLIRTYPANPVLEKSKEQGVDSENLKGTYSFANFKINVENEKKVKIDMAGQRINLKQKEVKNTYKVTPILLKFIPIPVKSIEMVFYKIDDDVYISQNDLGSNRNMVVGLKVDPKPIPDAWRERLGKYIFIDATKTNFRAMDLTKASCNVSIEDGLLKVEFSEGGILDKSYLIAHDDDMAYSIGIGRNTGYSLAEIANGNLSFMGFEMEKVK